MYLAADDGTVHLSFAAAQSRALSRPRRARELANQHPATYVAFDILAHPAAGFPDLRARPYVERRQVLLDVLADVGPPIVPVWSTTDLEVALFWSETLEGTGVEGIVAKPLRSAYKAGRVWAKVRHADIVDATVVGFTGTARHPKALAVRLSDGRVALSPRLTTALFRRHLNWWLTASIVAGRRAVGTVEYLGERLLDTRASSGRAGGCRGPGPVAGRRLRPR